MAGLQSGLQGYTEEDSSRCRALVENVTVRAKLTSRLRFCFCFFFFLSQLGAKWLSEAAMEGAMSPVGGETEPEL